MRRVLSLLLAAVIMLGILPSLSPQTKAATGGKLIAITFDDGPGAYTQRLLDGLKARNVHVTFFMVGRSAATYPDTVKRVYQEGHQVANHSYDHSELTSLSLSEAKSQITRTNSILDKACGSGTSYLVRAPYGSTNSSVRSAIGVPFIYWSVDTLDWKYRNATTVKNNILNDAADGAIVLLHDIHSTTVDGALAAIDVLLDRGYELVTVNELFRRRGVALENASSYTRCRPTGTDLGPVEKPTITAEPEGGKLRITMTCQSGASIYYSTDGSQLNQESTRYTGSFLISAPCTIKAAAAFNMNGSRSDTVSVTFDKPAAEKPQFQVTDGVMTLTCKSSDASIYYTLDGAPATTRSTLYTQPVALTPGTLVRAAAGGTAYQLSEETFGYYTRRGNFFRDVFPADWYFDTIDQVVELGYMQGVGSHKFRPQDPLTRGQLVLILYRYAAEQVTQEQIDQCPFVDADQRDYYRDAICWAYASGIVDGCSAHHFLPERNVSRQEMCKIIAAFLTYRNKRLPESTEFVLSYQDTDEIAAWAMPYVESTTAVGLFQGDGSNRFFPNACATRAETAVVLLRLSGLEASLPDIPPAEPENPGDTTDPTEPTEITVPPETDDTTEPTDEPTEPVDTTEPDATTEPTGESTDPTEAAPTDATDPADGTEP